ncbi:MAG: hypothetical protein IPI00_09055 [Flavobacteriales bacterium]|nr:hypothetical protein [Flavobacteriales bacterium]MBK6944109.1 hypothetical protein [Flavobacteriales bacterium]MBK7240312.1 hypothetical protein [Flavobacteriales bacterium]MBK7295399.1 hypothetical protein [Flavobacteriales bacterium]MBK9533777.1 hypothetical protein [Flavobacteriales bacterium]
MNKHHFSSRSLFVFALSAGIVLTACKKDDDPEPAAPDGGSTSSTPSTTPNFVDADASLWGVKTWTTTTTPIGNVTVEIGVGIAVFSNDDFASFVNVGTVGVNGTDLTAQSNNSYTSTPSQANPLGIDFSNSNTDWTVAGDNGFAGFTRSVPEFAFPAIDAVSSSDVVVRANGYTLTVQAVASADSMLFLVGSVAKTLVGSATSCDFTADELSGLATGTSLVQVAAYSYINEDQGGKNIYFGKETVRTKTVTIQ